MHQLNDMSENMKADIEFARQRKLSAVENEERGDLMPHLVVERDGKTWMVIVAPEVDKNLGLSAAWMAHTGVDPDSVTLILDARMKCIAKEVKEGQTKEDLEKEFGAKLEPGILQKMVEEGKRDEENIVDCVICHHIKRDGTLITCSLPYKYDGTKESFAWLKDLDWSQSEQNEGVQIVGLIPAELKKIMAQPTTIDKILECPDIKKKFIDFCPDRMRFTVARTMIAFLAKKNFKIIDKITSQHPEWTNAKPIALAAIDKMVEDGFLPKEAKTRMKDCIETYMGTPEFKEKFTELLKSKKYWLPATVAADIEDFVQFFEAFCLSLMISDHIKPDDDYNSKEEDDDILDNDIELKRDPERVNVWNGDHSEFLGEGSYVGDVTVWFIQMPDGSIRSNRNAERKPTPEQVPDDAEVVCAGKNPKIVLDDGKVVYGCQVWWERTNEKYSPKNN